MLFRSLPRAQQTRLKQIQHAGWQLLGMIDELLNIARQGQAEGPAPASAMPSPRAPKTGRAMAVWMLSPDTPPNTTLSDSLAQQNGVAVYRAPPLVTEGWSPPALLSGAEMLVLELSRADERALQWVQWCQAQPVLRGKPMVVVTAAAQPEQVDALLAAGAHCHLKIGRAHV